jgi:predicted Kef-type K+ transport protein
VSKRSRSLATRTQTIAAGLLQATSISFLVVAGQIGVRLGLLRPAVYAALVAAGLLSVLLFPLTALTLLRTSEDEPEIERVNERPAARVQKRE